MNLHGTVVSPVFDYAVDRGYAPANPCRRVRLPQRRGRSVKAHHVVDVDQMPEWIGCAYQVDTDTGDVIALILGTGLRWGELTALRVCDVNIRAATLTVARVVREDENRQPYLDDEEGKSANAFRTIALPATAVRILTTRMAGKAPGDLLFPAPGTRGGLLWRSANFHIHRWSKVKRLAAERGLVQDPSPHRLRHSHATAPGVGAYRGCGEVRAWRAVWSAWRVVSGSRYRGVRCRTWVQAASRVMRWPGET